MITGFAALIALTFAATAPAVPPVQPNPSPAEAARQQSNDEQAEKARQQVGENFAREDNYTEAVRKREAEIKRQQADYAAALAQHAAQEAAFQQAMVVWRAQACRSGHKIHCLPK